MFFSQLPETLLIGLNEHASPTALRQVTCIREMHAIPRSELHKKPVFHLCFGEELLDDTILAVLRIKISLEVLKDNGHSVRLRRDAGTNGTHCCRGAQADAKTGPL